ncbi:MAG TPA: response regulator transcription factor [Anaerolineae bacterium]|nr:response regulator transcription factor [Anaerolineae bacterium]
MRILVADHQMKVRFALRTLLDRRPGLEVVGESDSPEEVLAQVRTVSPDLVLLHWRMCEAVPGLLSAMRRAYPELHVIVLSVRPETRHAAMAAGADAFVCKMDPPDKLLAAVEKVESSQHQGEGNSLTGLQDGPRAVKRLLSEGGEEETGRLGPFLLGKGSPERVPQ